MTVEQPCVSIADVCKACERLSAYVHRTPVMTCGAIDELAGRRLFFKCENFQKVGAFKFRGAMNAVLALDTDAAARGVVTHSSGNHAQALALAAKIRGIEAHIVMPRTAPVVKKRAVLGYGATVYECEPTLAAREEATQQVIERIGATLIHPYNNSRVIAGQGTCALELIEQVQEQGSLSAIIAPIGGGGLMSGTCISAQGRGVTTRVFGTEPVGADDAARSLVAGRLIQQNSPNTIADGLLTSMGSLTWPIISAHVERIFTVTDEQIIAAMRLVWERMKIIIEPSAAVPVAAVLCSEFKDLPDIETVGVILTGGNVDLDRLPWVNSSERENPGHG